MPRGIPNKKPETNGAVVPSEQPPLERALADVRTMLEARKAEYTTAVDRINDILASMDPKPRVGRPPKVTS